MHSLANYYKKLRLLLKRRQVTIMAAGLAGLLAGSVFAFGLPYFLLIPVLVVLLYSVCMENSEKQKWYRSTDILIGFLFFFLFHTTVFSWFLDADIGGLVAVGSVAAQGYAILSLVVMAAVLSVPMVATVHITVKYRGSWYFPFIIAVAWVVGEWARSLLFSIFLYGNGASIGDYWNFGSLGLAAMDGPFAASSRFLGLYGLTFITILLAAILHQIFLYKKRWSMAILGSVIIIVACLPGWLSNPVTDRVTQASVLQEKSNVPDLGNQTPIESFSDKPKSLIVLPEYSSTYQPFSEAFTQQYISSRLDEVGVSVSVREPMPDNRFGRLVFRNSEGEIKGEQTKQLLIPTGEYLPYIVIALFHFASQPEVVEHFEQTRRVHKGLPPSTFTHNGIRIGSVACSGILARNIFRQMSREGAEVLTNSASLLDFNHSQSYFRQSVQMARFHAMANSRTYVQSTVGAPAFVINHDGKFIVPPGMTETKFIDFVFVPRTHKTLYTKAGEWPLLLCGAILAIFGIVGLQKKAKSRRRV